MMRLANKVALVTGGGSGPGEAISKRLAAEGAALSVSDIDATSAERGAAQIRAADESRYMTGAELVIDGGYTAR